MNLHSVTTIEKAPAPARGRAKHIYQVVAKLGIATRDQIRNETGYSINDTATTLTYMVTKGYLSQRDAGHSYVIATKKEFLSAEQASADQGCTIAVTAQDYKYLKRRLAQLRARGETGVSLKSCVHDAVLALKHRERTSGAVSANTRALRQNRKPKSPWWQFWK